MELHTWLVYLTACVALSISPGPNGLLALTHGAMYGQRLTLFTIAGGAAGFVLLIALSMFGIGALLQASLVWLTVLKVVGGVYLVWLGIQLWRSPPLGESMVTTAGTVSPLRLFRQGFLSAASNPKGILFFAAFLPQFINPQRDLWLQFLVMASTFAATEIAYELTVAAAAHRVRRWLVSVGRKFNQACGAVFGALGIGLALRD